MLFPTDTISYLPSPGARMTRQSRDDTPQRPDPAAQSLSAPRSVAAMPHHQAQELTDGGKLAQIQLGDQVYTLRITRAEKLILTK